MPANLQESTLQFKAQNSQGHVETEEELLRSRAELKAIYDTAPVMMCVVDSERRILYANAAFTEFTGIPEEDLRGGFACGVFGCINALENPKGCGFGITCTSCGLLAAMEDTLKTGQPHLEIEYSSSFIRGGTQKDVVMLGSTALIQSGGQARLLLCLHDISARTKAEERIKALLLEKELMLKETHHRIKNNMAVIIGLLNLQSDNQEDEASCYALKDAAGRVQSMMCLYEKLYHAENQLKIPVSSYLTPLVAEIIQLYDSADTVRTHIDIEDFMLGTELLSPLGIMINELVTNSLKYAFRHTPEPLIHLGLTRFGGKIVMEYSDNGIGLPDLGDPDQPTGFGTQLIGLLVQQIKGTLAVERNGFTKYTVSFKDPHEAV